VSVLNTASRRTAHGFEGHVYCSNQKGGTRFIME
jgi:hypothetical protein